MNLRTVSPALFALLPLAASWPALAQGFPWPKPREYLQGTRKSTLDLNGDGVSDIRITYTFDGWSDPNTSNSAQDASWGLITLGRTRLLTGAADGAPAIPEAGNSVYFEPIFGQAWRGWHGLLASRKQHVNGLRPWILDSSSGPFGNRSGHLAFLVEGVDGDQVCWLEIISDGQERIAGAKGASPALEDSVVVGETTTPAMDAHRTAVDADDDGLIDAVVERHWRQSSAGARELISLSVWPRNAVAALQTTNDPAAFPALAYLDDVVAPDPGPPLALAGRFLAEVVYRTLLSANPPPPLIWSTNGPVIALVADLVTGNRFGPLSTATNVWVPLRLGPGRATTLLVSADGAVTQKGCANAGFQMVGETDLPGVGRRFDFNEDGLVDAISYAFSDPLVSSGLRSASILQLIELGLTDSLPIFFFGLDDPQTVPLGFKIAPPTHGDPASIDAYPGLYGRLLLAGSGDTPFSPGTLIQFGPPNGQFITLRVNKPDGWHAGWLNYSPDPARINLETYYIEPKAWAPAYAGLYLPPDDQPVLEMRAGPKSVKFSWNPLLMGYRLEERTLAASGKWVPVTGMISSSNGAAEVSSSGAAKLYRLQPTF